MPDERRPLTGSFERFCACLNHFEVNYVIVGSEALAVHGVPRYSLDFDAFVRATCALGDLLHELTESPEQARR